MQKSIKVIVKQQLLIAIDGDSVWKSFKISTARKGIGQQYGSEQTPLGRHIVRAKIGGEAAVGAVFRGRRPTGEIYSPLLSQQHSERDWILTRIMWLSGCERGINRLGSVDTMRRYVYIHGCPAEKFSEKPFTHGCIGMTCPDIVCLYQWTPAGTPVEIIA